MPNHSNQSSLVHWLPYSPGLDRGTYNVRMTVPHQNAANLQLTSQVTIGGVGEFTSIGANIPVIK